MPQQDGTTLELISLSRQVSDLQAAVAARDAEILRLKKRVNDLIGEVTRLSTEAGRLVRQLEIANSIIQDVY